MRRRWPAAGHDQGEATGVPGTLHFGVRLRSKNLQARQTGRVLRRILARFRHEPDRERVPVGDVRLLFKRREVAVREDGSQTSAFVRARVGGLRGQRARDFGLRPRRPYQVCYASPTGTVQRSFGGTTKVRFYVHHVRSLFIHMDLLNKNKL